ncbi:hypothetical protein [[Eubacterium] cellulosolvens]
MGRIIIYLYWVTFFLFVKIRAKRNNLPEPQKIFWINPQQIVYGTIPGFSNWDMGKIKGGNWDEKRYRFGKLDVYTGFRDRIILKKQWLDTDYYKIMLNELRANKSAKGFRNKEELDDWFRYLDYLCTIIKEDGYKLNKDISQARLQILFKLYPTYVKKVMLSRKFWTPKEYNIFDEIAINIGRNGEYLFNRNGRHRLAIVKTIGLPSIPVQIIVRHEKFLDVPSTS